MIEERALVVTVEGEGEGHRLAKVRSERQSACNSCSLKAGCGQSTLAKLSSRKCIELTVSNELNAKPGDIVLLTIPEQGLLTASLLVYMMPLLMMVIFSVLAESFLGWEDLAVVLAGISALITGFGLARLYTFRHLDDTRFTPVMMGFAEHRTD